MQIVSIWLIFKEKGWSFVSSILFDSVVCFYSVTGKSGWHICWQHILTRQTVEAFMPHYPLVVSEDIGIKSIWTDNLGVLSNVIHHIHNHTKYNMQWNACVRTDRLWGGGCLARTLIGNSLRWESNLRIPLQRCVVIPLLREQFKPAMH